MALGPGKYDKALTRARKLCGSNSALLIVIEGEQGRGFSAQTLPHHLPMLPSLLRHIADEIESSGPNKHADIDALMQKLKHVTPGRVSVAAAYDKDKQQVTLHFSESVKALELPQDNAIMIADTIQSLVAANKT